MSSDQKKLADLFAADKLTQKAQRFRSLGRLDLAEQSLTQALNLKQGAIGAQHPGVATTLDALGVIYLDNKLYAQAQDCFKRAIEILEKAYYADHASIAPVATHFADSYDEQGKYAEAEPYHKRAVDINTKTLSGEHHDTLHSILQLAICYRHLGKYAEAEPILKKALKTTDSPLGPSEEFAFELALDYQVQGKVDEARAAYKDAIAGYDMRNKFHRLATCLESYAQFLRSLHEPEAAEVLTKRATNLRSQYNRSADNCIFSSNLV